MKNLIFIFIGLIFVACEKEQTLQAPPVVNAPVQLCNCHVWELEAQIKIVNGLPQQHLVWVEDRFWGEDCSDDGKQFTENGIAHQIRCVTK